MSDITNDLSKLEDAYQNASSEGFTIDPGEYVFWIRGAEIVKAMKSDRLQVKMECVIVSEGKFMNSTHYSYDLRFTDANGVPDERAMGFFKLACFNLGLNGDVPARDLPAVVAAMIDRVFKGALVKNGEYTNLRIRSLVHPQYTKWVEEGRPESGTKKDKGW